MGLGLPDGYRVQLDLDGLFRMDQGTLVETLTKGVRGSLYAPNEGRKRANLKPLEGGDTVYMQHQDYSLAALAWRDAQPNPFAPQGPAPEPPTDDDVDDDPVPELNAEESAKYLAYKIQQELCA